MKLKLKICSSTQQIRAFVKAVVALSMLTACTSSDTVDASSGMYKESRVFLESQTKITDGALHFDGKKLNHKTFENPSSGSEYDYFFGRNISAHGDAVKPYKHYVFMTWYKGGKEERNVML